MDKLTELNALTHQYRKTLEQFAERNDAKTLAGVFAELVGKKQAGAGADSHFGGCGQ